MFRLVEGLRIHNNESECGGCMRKSDRKLCLSEKGTGSLEVLYGKDD